MYSDVENDVYVKELIDLIISQNSPNINIEIIKKAAFYAKKYHGTQMRQSGEPYYSHPVAVAIKLARNY